MPKLCVKPSRAHHSVVDRHRLNALLLLAAVLVCRTRSCYADHVLMLSMYPLAAFHARTLAATQSVQLVDATVNSPPSPSGHRHVCTAPPVARTQLSCTCTTMIYDRRIYSSTHDRARVSPMCTPTATCLPGPWSSCARGARAYRPTHPRASITSTPASANEDIGLTRHE
jgi:hypothetical protein